MREARRQLRVETLKFENLIAHHGKFACRPLCEAMHKTLSRELRDMIYEYLIKGHNITFCQSGGGTVIYANGRSAIHHCFDPSYTRYEMHKDILGELGHKNSRFDFRGHHDMVGNTFLQYKSGFGFDLVPIIRNIGVIIKPDNVKKREVMFRDLQAFSTSKKVQRRPSSSRAAATPRRKPHVTSARSCESYSHP